QIDAVLARVLADVADDVGELKRDAEISGVVERARVAIAEDAGGEQSDDARHAIAIRLEPGPVEIARLPEVHLHAVDDLVEPRGAEAVPVAMRLERARHRMLRAPGEQIRHLRAPPRELRRGDLRIHAFVDHVVDFPAEGVERRDGAAALHGKEEERVVKAGAAGGSFLLAILVGRHAARSSTRGQSKAPSTGRRRKTSNSTRSI